MEAGQDRGECPPAREGYRGELVLSDAPRNLAGEPTTQSVALAANAGTPDRDLGNRCRTGGGMFRALSFTRPARRTGRARHGRPEPRRAPGDGHTSRW